MIFSHLLFPSLYQILLIRSLSHREPFQYSKLLVLILNPIVPIFGLLGLPALFQDGILF